MTTPPVRVERRAGQRFSFLLPVSLRESSSGTEGLGFTQDLSSRGVFFFTDAALHEGGEIELTLNMPSEITLGETMRVRCRGRVLRVVKRSDPGLLEVPARSETKVGVAVRFDGYEYLPEAADGPATFQRVSSLHGHGEEEQPLRGLAHVPPL
ncbi:MAG: PilZ domain-containing protein [Acidobacteriia bacterium]|nr:PilZ domain-containing protein [Terriglobia bacterium]